MEEDHKISYLQLIQNSIDRMGTNSTITKGFAASTIAGVAIVDNMEKISLMAFVYYFPLCAFLALDLYYLILEKKFRYLYSSVNSGEHKCDYKFDLVNRKDKDALKSAGARIRDCIFSPSILLFYPALIITIAIILHLEA